MSEHRHRPAPNGDIEGLQVQPEVWAEMIRTLGIDRVALLLRTPLVLKAELLATEERMQRKAA